MSKPNWIPLESNPDIMNTFMEEVGVPEIWKISDVYGLDDDSISFIPQPVLAIILLFPKEAKDDTVGNKSSEDVYFIKQSVGGACGTIALLHAIGNNSANLGIASDSAIGKFLEDTKWKNPEERGESLKNNVVLCESHANAAMKGQTKAPKTNKPRGRHFAALIHHNGVLFELDGGNEGPIQRGDTSDSTFLKDAAAVCKQYMSRAPNNVNFSIMALAPGD